MCLVFVCCDIGFGVVDNCVLGVSVGWSCGPGGMCWCEMIGLGCLVLELGFVSKVLEGLVGGVVVFHGWLLWSMVPVLNEYCLCGILGLVHVMVGVGEFVGGHRWGMETFVLVEIV